MSPPDTLVERMARALWDDRETHQHPRCRQTWEQGSETARRFAIDHAYAILQAMRDLPDLLGNELPESYRPGSHSARSLWALLIDAALTQPRPL